MSRNLPSKLAKASEEQEESEEKGSGTALVPAPTDDQIGVQGGVKLRAKPATKVTVKQFRVKRGPQADGSWKIVHNGAMTRLAMGKILDGRAYDIQRLRNLGVELEDAGEIQV